MAKRGKIRHVEAVAGAKQNWWLLTTGQLFNFFESKWASLWWLARMDSRYLEIILGISSLSSPNFSKRDKLVLFNLSSLLYENRPF